MEPSEFWKWSHFADYMIAFGSFAALMSVLTALLLNVSWYIETIGWPGDGIGKGGVCDLW